MCPEKLVAMNTNKRLWVIVVWVWMCGLLCTSSAEENFCVYCPGGCDNRRQCTPYSNCKQENVALGKLANSSSLYTSQQETSGPACLAVNGNTGTTFLPISRYPDSPNCVHTRAEYNASWWVDLGTIYPVSRITIYNRDTNQDKIRGARIYVDNQPCFTFGNNYPTSSTKMEVTCDILRRGRTVTLTATENSFLNFCEFEVWVCLPGRFGPTCDQLCRCKDNTTCDQYDGFCFNGCEDGFYSSTCNQTCHCKDNSACDFTTGMCPSGCQSGWMGLSCNTTCLPGTFGPNCQQTCGKCKFSPCDRTTGVCDTGCAVGYTTAYCDKPCDSGTYGEECRRRCGQCKNGDPCDVTTGICPGGCQAGWELSYCVTNCRARTYGENCSLTCGQCENGAACDVTSGACAACKTNFVGSLCQDCVTGMHGNACDRKCVNCDNDGSCDRLTGQCVHGCRAGWMPDKCVTECPAGKFGKNCAQNCGNCSSSAPCRHDDGRCEGGCADGFEGDLCQAVVGLKPASENTPKALIIGVVVGAVVLAVIVIAVVIVITKRRKRQSRQDATEAHTVLHNNHIYDNPDKQEETVLSFTPKTVENYGKATDKTPARKKVEKVQSLPEDTTENIYVNVALAKSGSQSSLDTLIDDDNNGLDRSMESLGDDGNLYGNDESVYATFQQSSGPQLDSVQRHLVDRLASGQLPVVFDELPKGLTDDHHTAKLKTNFKKNRFASVLPYDSYRVVLSDGYCEHNATDFINASRITGYHNEKLYIAAQGPRDNTVVDFWRMVWQEQVTQIIMLTKLIEAGKEKCFEYWPSPGSLETFGPVTVAGSEVRHRANFAIRKFIIRMDGVERKVEQFHYLGWPDHGVPAVASLLSFWHFARARTPRRPHGPLLVHCSAGVGRTGAYIGLDIAFDQAINKAEVNIDAIVRNMRSERCLMVQTVDQFIFLYKAVLEAYTGRDTVIPLDRFDVTFPQPISASRDHHHIDREFRTLMQMRSLTAEVPRSVAKQRENLAKNRNPDCLPSDGHLVYLTAHLEGRNQFINAVFMPSYQELRGNILTQLPLPATLVDFWRLVDGNDVSTIVSLGFENEEHSVQNFCKYWPDEEQAIQTGPYTVQHLRTATLGGHLASHWLQMTKEGEAWSRDVRVLRYNDWAEDVPSDVSDLMRLVETLGAARTKTEKPQPVVIQCIDGVSRSGLFCAVCNIISRLTLDQDVDVFMTVREIQSVVPEAVTSETQYRYCYVVAQQFTSEVNVYANA